MRFYEVGDSKPSRVWRRMPLAQQELFLAI
ncbi:hypothetical protein FOXB_10425 [Fusarium oxysporum f. sp. conglutinans Fo5176]|uniref:Uncharacterized protein n=1 Tax=Fusarium oxysporum (strain Fo5176) TaxID=660025 RepID=F9FVJ4_FUSOF|nr:hypothetical protein FOXB_10425 [Fusarium oxysporum f. sp. conglutinans Fo5176]